MAVIPEGLIQSLQDVATRLRIDVVRATTAAASGHPSSSASSAELIAAAMFGVMRLDPERPRDVANDRLVLSKGHAAPVLYAAWAELGVVSREELTTLRDLGSDLEGHPTPRLPFVDVATGSLGQGLGVGLGLAIGARMTGSDARVFVVLGDGELAEGSVWEAAALASHRQVDRLIAVVDINAMGQSGPTMLGHDVERYRRRFTAFGWRAIAVDGHDIAAVVVALRRARAGRGAPTAVLARTIKGYGLVGIEGREGWHGKPLPSAEADAVVEQLTAQLRHVPPRRPERPRGRSPRVPRPERSMAQAPGPAPAQIATRQAYGDALVRLGAVDPRIVVLDGDVKNSTYADRFAAAYPERYIESYIAEQNMVSVAAGLAAQDWVPFASSFACFLTRAADQIRMAGISRSNVKFCGSHAGVSIGEDGPSQMGLEDLALFRAIPDAVVLYPADNISTDACVQLAAVRPGPVYIRTTRMATPPIYGREEAFTVGGLKVVRKSDTDRLTVVAAGITLHEALAAADELQTAGVAVRVIDLYCVKPVDRQALLQAAGATNHMLLTVEDHYPEGGLGAAVLEAVGDTGVVVHRLAVSELPRSGAPRKLIERHRIGRAAIVDKVRELIATPAMAPAGLRE